MKALYVTDRAAAGDARFVAILEALRDAESLTVQLREKNGTDRETIAWARLAREKLGPRVSLFVNLRFDVALAAGAQGVHLPADGLPARRVKANTPRGFRVGVSTHSAAQAREALEEGADLVVLGPVFATPSKAAFGEPLGPRVLADLPRLATHGAEVFAIGGVTEENLALLDPYRDRISGVAAVRLFQQAEEPAALAERIARR